MDHNMKDLAQKLILSILCFPQLAFGNIIIFKHN